MKTLKAALIVIAIVALAGVVWWYRYTGTPQHSLLLLADAVKAKDYETARYFVDDERLAETASKSVVDVAIQHVTKDMKASENPFSGLGIAAIEMMAPRVREAAKDNVKDAIRQALSGDDSLTNRAGAQRWDLSRFSQLRIETCVVSGNTAEVLIGGIPQPNPVQLSEVHLRMARIRNSRNWRIEEIPEIAQAYIKLMESEKSSAQTVADTSNTALPSTPAVTLLTPNLVLEQLVPSVCGIDFPNSQLVEGDSSVKLTNGKYEKRDGLTSESVTLKNVFCFHERTNQAEHAVVATDWMGCGASCHSSGAVQIFTLRDNHPLLTQQIDFDSNAEGTGAIFDDNSQTLTITGRSNEESPDCCPKSLDVVTYRWEGQQFVQSSYKRIPCHRHSRRTGVVFDGAIPVTSAVKASDALIGPTGIAKTEGCSSWGTSSAILRLSSIACSMVSTKTY